MAAIMLTNSPKALTITKTLTLTLPRLFFSTFPPLTQEIQTQFPSSLTSSPLKFQNPCSSTTGWIHPDPVPLSVINTDQSQARMLAFAQTLDATSLRTELRKLLRLKRDYEVIPLFQAWIRSLGGANANRERNNNKPNRTLYNYYLMANYFHGKRPRELLDLLAKMEEEHGIVPDTRSYNLVFSALYESWNWREAEKLIYRMLQTGPMPDGESYDLVIDVLIWDYQLDSALKIFNLALKYGKKVSPCVRVDFICCCHYDRSWDILSSIINIWKTTEQTDDLIPANYWEKCIFIAEDALEEDNAEVASHVLQFLAKHIASAKPSAADKPFVNEGFLVSALDIAIRTFNSSLCNVLVDLLRFSLPEQRVPSPVSYLSMILALSSLGNLKRAFCILGEFETVYGNSKDIDHEAFSPFTKLYPLVVACCCRNVISSFDMVYAFLELYKSVAGLNCIILGYANMCDPDRAHNAFRAIEEKFGLTPDIHSYNALMFAFGKVGKASEASSLFKRLGNKDVKPNATTYTWLVEAHIVNRDPKTAILVLDDMVDAGFTPSLETLKKVRRRCYRESDSNSQERIVSLARWFNYQMDSQHHYHYQPITEEENGRKKENQQAEKKQTSQFQSGY